MKLISWKVGIASLGILSAATIWIAIMLSVILLVFTGVTTMRLWKSDDTLIEHEVGCECGCIWVENLGHSVEVETVRDENGEVLEAIGTAEITEISLDDIDDKTTSGGAIKTANLTASITDGYLGLKLGDWIYISDKGCYQVQDIISENNSSSGGMIIYTAGNTNGSTSGGSQGSTLNPSIKDIYDTSNTTNENNESSDERESNTEENTDTDESSTTTIKKTIYFIKDDVVQDGDQSGIEIPKVSTTQVDVPSYGASTGSLTDTSTVRIEKSSLDENRQILLDLLLPGAVVASQYYNVHINTVLGLAPFEGGWPNIKDPVGHEFHLFSLQKAGPITGTTTKDGGRWSTHVDAEEAVIHYAWNYHKKENFVSPVLPGEGYAQVLAAYSKGYEEQIRRHALSGFNNYYESGAKDVEDYKRMAENYKNNIISVTKKIKDINNIDVAMQYLKDNNLMDKYNNALKWMKTYEEKFGHYINDVPNGGAQTSGAFNPDEVASGSAGYWSCSCTIPCTYCNCHDTEKASETAQMSTGSSLSFPPSTPGKTSGLVGTYDDLVKAIEALNSSNAPRGATNIEKLKSNLKGLMQYVGMSPASITKYREDKFAGPDGIGYVRYRQGGPGTKEEWASKSYNAGSATFTSSACGIYSMSMIISSLTKTWCSPPEVAVVIQTYGIRHGGNWDTTQQTSQGALLSANIARFYEEFGLRAKYSASISKEEVDKCLDDNGMVQICITDPDGSISIKTDGHFIVIRQKTDDGKYLLGDSCRVNENHVTWDEIAAHHKHTAVYVRPNENFKLYDPNTSSGTNTGSTGSTGSTLNPSVKGTLTPEIRDKIIKTGEQYIGVKYKLGGKTPETGFDCSGFVKYVYGKCGITLPAGSQNQFGAVTKMCNPIKGSTIPSGLQPGDLVFYGKSESESSIGHVAIWAGNGKILHAPQEGQTVCYESHEYMFGSGPNDYKYGFYGRP